MSLCPQTAASSSAPATTSDLSSHRDRDHDRERDREPSMASSSTGLSGHTSASVSATSRATTQQLLDQLLRHQQQQLQPQALYPASQGAQAHTTPAVHHHHHSSLGLQHQQGLLPASLFSPTAASGAVGGHTGPYQQHHGHLHDLHGSLHSAPPGFAYPHSPASGGSLAPPIGYGPTVTLAQQRVAVPQPQPAQQQVLVLLPSSVAVTNLNLSQVVAEAENKMQRPITFADLVLTVASTPLLAGADLAHSAKGAQDMKRVLTANASVQTNETRLQEDEQVSETRQMSAVTMTNEKQQEQEQFKPEPIRSAGVSRSISTAATTPSTSSSLAMGDWPESDTPFSILTSSPATAPSTTHPSPGVSGARTISHSRAPPALGAGLQSYAPSASSSTAAPSLSLALVTTERPPGDGPAPFHVTIRCLRPSTSALDLLQLARSTHSLVKLFYPPYAKKNHAGRAATFFFTDRKDAYEFGLGLRKRNDRGELHDKFGLTEHDLQGAYRRGVRGDGPDGKFTDRTTKLAITMSDEKKREEVTQKYYAHRLPATQGKVIDLKAWLRGESKSSSATRHDQNDHDDDDDDDEYDDGTGDFAPSTWDPAVLTHYNRMFAADNAHDTVAVNAHPLSLVTSSAPAGLDPSTRSIIVQNVRPSVAPTDLLALARHCKSLQAIYYPPLDLKSDRVGRTAMFFLEDKVEARGFFEYLKTLIRNNKGQIRKQYEVRPSDEMEARTKRKLVGKKVGGAFAAWQVKMKVMFGGGFGQGHDDEDENEESEDVHIDWVGERFGTASKDVMASSSAFAKDVWGGGDDGSDTEEGHMLWGSSCILSARGV